MIWAMARPSSVPSPSPKSLSTCTPAAGKSPEAMSLAAPFSELYESLSMPTRTPAPVRLLGSVVRVRAASST